MTPKNPSMGKAWIFSQATHSKVQCLVEEELVQGVFNGGNNKQVIIITVG